MSLMQIPVKKLVKIIDPFVSLVGETETDAWGEKTSIQDVLDCLQRNEFEEEPYSDGSFPENYHHAKRIAFLVKNIPDDPIQLDVGIPSLDYLEITLEDGYHRLAAAIVRGDKTIDVEISGEIDYAKHLFVRKRKKYMDI